MKTYKSLFRVGALALAAGFTSCSDDEEYDFPGTTTNFVYQKDGSSNFKIIQTPISTISTVDVQIPVQCTKKAQGDIKVTFGIDNSLIDAYNEEHNTDYVALPENVLVIENQTVTIPSGAMKGETTVNIKTTDDETILNQLSDDNDYLVPIVRKSVEGSNAIPSEQVNPVTYIIMTVVHDNVHHGASASDSKGTMVADQSGWSASVNEGTTVSGDLKNLFDGNFNTTATMQNRTNDGIDLIVDMGKEYTFDALTLYYGYSYPGWGDFTYGQLTSDLEITTSSDAQKWTKVGLMESGDSDTVMVFYAPITARYIKIHKPYSYYARLYGGVFNVYAL